MENALAKRIDDRLRELGIGPVEAAARVPGLERNYIRDLLDGKKRSFSQAKVPLVARALDWSEGDLTGASLVPQPEPDPNAVVGVPLLDYVSAGKLASPMSQVPQEDVPVLAFAGLGRGEFFALRVAGTSMNRIAPEGSLIVVNRRDRTLVSDRCYVFAVRGETTFKKWQGGETPYLAPWSWDDSHKPIFVKRKKDFEVIGRVSRCVVEL